MKEPFIHRIVRLFYIGIVQLGEELFKHTALLWRNLDPSKDLPEV